MSFTEDDTDELYLHQSLPRKVRRVHSVEAGPYAGHIKSPAEKAQGAEHHADNNGQILAAAHVPSFFYHRHYRLPELLPVAVLF